MMINLFSVFDPCTGFLSLNWISSSLLLIFIPYIFWYIPCRMMMLMNMSISLLSKEICILLGNESKKEIIVFISLFIFIFYNNFLGLLPYIFTSSSHLIFTLTMALPLWLTFMIFGWLYNTNYMFIHLVPMGTPGILMPFMVCIETISNIIRPGSLAVRLTANMIAGHLLMTLLGNSSINLGMSIFFVMLIQMLLILFELAVSIIQAYVFTVLSTLYSSEVT
uniref:ATP synthase subunit a n=1 Tax=Derotettix mendosensis TaxID=2219932 RepID=A0A3S7MGJ6_9HEMI|nr:ATP synthase F0 subunit 6 [Derotettix mendosensis]